MILLKQVVSVRVYLQRYSKHLLTLKKSQYEVLKKQNVATYCLLIDWYGCFCTKFSYGCSNRYGRNAITRC